MTEAERKEEITPIKPPQCIKVFVNTNQRETREHNGDQGSFTAFSDEKKKMNDRAEVLTHPLLCSVRLDKDIIQSQSDHGI